MRIWALSPTTHSESIAIMVRIFFIGFSVFFFGFLFLWFSFLRVIFYKKFMMECGGWVKMGESSRPTARKHEA